VESFSCGFEPEEEKRTVYSGNGGIVSRGGREHTCPGVLRVYRRQYKERGGKGPADSSHVLSCGKGEGKESRSGQLSDFLMRRAEEKKKGRRHRHDRVLRRGEERELKTRLRELSAASWLRLHDGKKRRRERWSRRGPLAPEEGKTESFHKSRHRFPPSATTIVTREKKKKLIATTRGDVGQRGGGSKGQTGSPSSAFLFAQFLRHGRRGRRETPWPEASSSLLETKKGGRTFHKEEGGGFVGVSRRREGKGRKRRAVSSFFTRGERGPELSISSCVC